MAGGVCALAAAVVAGPRSGKYTRDENGKRRSVAIPGHSVTISAMGVFLMWTGWMAAGISSAKDPAQAGTILVSLTIAPASSAAACMFFTWWKNGRPDVPLTLSAAAAGLVSAGAGCAYLDASGALITGAVSGVLMVTAMEYLEKKAGIDDPVGVIAIHGLCGMWGSVAVGLFDTGLGLFRSGNVTLLGVQLLGTVSVALFSAAVAFGIFLALRKAGQLRVTAEDEIVGMDLSEHGLVSAYADFLPSAPAHTSEEEFDLDMEDIEPVKLSDSASRSGRKYTKVSIICNEHKFGVLKDAMAVIGVTGMTVTNVVGCGVQKGKTGSYRGVRMSMNLLPKVQVDIVVSTVDPGLVVAVAKHALYTGNVGDGKIFVSEVDEVVRVRTGDMGVDALDDEK